MDKYLTRIFSNKQLFSDIIFGLGELIFSILCLIIVKNIWISLIYLIITSGFGIAAKIYTDNELEKIIGFLTKINKKVIYFIFIMIALLPMIVGYATGEIAFLGIKDFVKKMFYNPIQNCLGVLIVCSVMSHLAKFNTEQMISSVVHAQKIFFDIIMRFSFMGAGLCALKYKIDDELRWVNYFNSLHLFVIIFSGALALSIFALRIVDKRPFDFSAKQIYPTPTLLFAALFLLSCNLPAIFLEEVKHEVLLLTLNTSVALIVIWFLFFIIKKKTAKNTDEYPYTAPGLVSGCIISNLCFGIFSVENEVNKGAQFLSGICILLFVLLIIIYINQQRTDTGNTDIE